MLLLLFRVAAAGREKASHILSLLLSMFALGKVSNVFSRTEFLSTLHDTLGFEPKVDFNAGVVAAGEAQIESTVTGNELTLETSDKLVTLRDQSQVYLPINNALVTYMVI
jgi:hypothetical protein